MKRSRRMTDLALSGTVTKMLVSFIFLCIVLSEHIHRVISSFNRISGSDSYVVPPVPIPNTAVKHINAESTWLETAREVR